MRSAGFEPTTYGLGIRRSILLSYDRLLSACVQIVVLNQENFQSFSDNTREVSVYTGFVS